MNKLHWNKMNIPPRFSYASEYYESQQVKLKGAALHRYVILNEDSLGWITGRIMIFDDSWHTLPSTSGDYTLSLKMAQTLAEKDFREREYANVAH